MAAKDIALEALLCNPDVFADVISNFVYNTPGIIRHEDLVLAETESKVHFPGDDSVHGQTRDVAMYDKREGVVYSLYGIENESSQKFYEVFRCMCYDGAAYYEQVTAARKSKRYKFYPVITTVLNYSNHEWSQPYTVHDALIIIPGSALSRVVPNYHLNVVDVGFISYSDRVGLSSDFKAVCAALTQLYGNDLIHDTEFSNGIYSHREELADVISAFNSDGIVESLTTVSKGGRTMYNSLTES